MRALIPLKVFLETNELEQGTLLIAKTDMWRIFSGVFLDTHEDNAYRIEIDDESMERIIGKTPFIHIKYLYVPIDVQKFHILSPEDEDINKFLNPIH